MRAGRLTAGLTWALRPAGGLLLAAALAGAPALAVERVVSEAPWTRIELARALEHGEGVSRDRERAAALYCEEIREGNVEAMHSLGWMFANGRGVPRDDEVAATLFAMAAFEGDVQAHAMVDLLGPRPHKVPACLVESAPARPVSAAPARDDLGDFLAARPAHQRPLADLVARSAADFGIEPRLALALAWAESAFDPRAVSSANAVGIMQLMPDTARRFGVRDSFDPQQNVRGGLAYLRWLLAYYRGKVDLVLAAYNAGEGTVDRYGGVPPYKETREYLARIRSLFADTDHPFDAARAAASPVVAAGVRLFASKE